MIFTNYVSICQQSLAAILILTLGACSTPPQKPIATKLGDYTHTKKYISWLIEQEMQSADVTGLSIALVDDNEIVWSQGFGYADKRANIKASADSVYHTGSISKIFTAVAAMQLTEQGKLDIDLPLQKYLPEFSIKSRFGNIEKITPRNLMTHHSGLPCNWMQGMIVRNPEHFTKVVTEIKEEYTAYPTDYIFSYSNLGFLLLGVTVGKLNNSSYAQYMDTHLLKPLGMTQSEFSTTIRSKSYDKGEEIETIPMRDLPSNGLNSSVNDIAHFMQMILAEGNYNGEKILNTKSLHEMFKVQNANVPLDFDLKVGLGWMLNGVDVLGGGTVLSHGGLTMNFHSMMALLPEHKLGVVVLSNSTTAQSIVKKITSETLKFALEAKTGIAQPKQIAKNANSETVTSAEIRSFEGYFDTLIGLIKVKRESDHFYTEIMGQKLELISHEDKELGLRFKLLGFIPIKIDALESVRLSLHKIDGREVLAMKNQGQTILVGEKLIPTSIPEHMVDFIGDYEALNKPDGPFFDSVRVVLEDGLLIGEFTFPKKETGFTFHPGFVYRMALKPVTDNAVVVAGIGPGKGETLHLLKIDSEKLINFSGFKFRKIFAASLTTRLATNVQP